MKKVNTECLKRIQLEILDVVADFCEKNEIKYWLDCGTLLGAIRHKGYIPWDDDIDIGMLRKDYDKFLSTFNKHNKRYVVKSIENDEHFLYPYAKILDRNTILFEPDKKGNKLSINIDLFVYDHAPNNIKMIEKVFKRRDFYFKCYNQQNTFKRPNGNIIRVLLVQLFRFYVRCFPKNYYIKKIVENSKRYNQMPAKYIGHFMAFSKMFCRKKVVEKIRKVEFEGKMYNAPAELDEYLKCFYGDYMKLPPMEERVSHHQFEAYIKN